MPVPALRQPARLGLLLLLLVFLFLLLRADRAGRLMRMFSDQAPDPGVEQVEAGEEYRLLEVLPAPESLPRGFTRRYGSCYHFTYEDPYEMGMGRAEITRMILSSNARCGLLVIGAGTAGDARKVADLLAAAAEGGLELLVLRVMLRPDWRTLDSAEGFVGLPWGEQAREAARRAYGGWVEAWRGPIFSSGIFETIFDESGLDASLAGRLRSMLVYLQILNEPNVAEEYSAPLPANAPFRNGLYAGDLRALGRKVCAFHIPLIRALTPPVVSADGGRVVYRTDVLPLRLVVPDIAAATGEQKSAYIAGCLDVLSRAQTDVGGLMSAEYIRTGVRGVDIAYGMHIYVPCGDPAGAVEAVRGSQIETVMNVIMSSAGAGLPLVSGVLVTEFGGSFAPGSGCDREAQRAIYAIATASVPDVPLFWWVYASRECGYGQYAGNTSREWDKSALVRFDAATRTFHACEAPP